MKYVVDFFLFFFLNLFIYFFDFARLLKRVHLISGIIPDYSRFYGRHTYKKVNSNRRKRHNYTSIIRATINKSTSMHQFLRPRSFQGILSISFNISSAICLLSRQQNQNFQYHPIITPGTVTLHAITLKPWSELAQRLDFTHDKHFRKISQEYRKLKIHWQSFFIFKTGWIFKIFL